MINYLYIQDLKDRLEEIEEERRNFLESPPTNDSPDNLSAEELWEYEPSYEEATEITELLATLDAERAEDGFIPENDFREYAIEFAEDIGAIENCCHWPATCIDWEQAADELMMDFSQFEYNGTTYYYR